jgi:hypothetical protein
MPLLFHVRAGGAIVPLNFTVLEPCDEPKLPPVIVTDAPIGPDAGFKLSMTGAVEVTVKPETLLVTLEAVTATPPEVAPAGTETWMLVGPQMVAGAAAMPLNLTVLEP